MVFTAVDKSVGQTENGDERGFVKHGLNNWPNVSITLCGQCNQRLC